MDSPASNARARSKLSPASQPNGTFADEPSTATMPPSPSLRPSPFLPTRIEAALLLAYPVLLTFGTLFSLVSPTVRNAPYDPFLQAHSQDPAVSPSYFARKSNIFNVFFVKRGWAWISLAFFVFLFSHPATANTQRRARALLRWGLVTTWWVLVTQWCFGPALIDRGFRFTGGKCELAMENIDAGGASKTDVFTGVACRAAGGRWYGGHDISGHVFLLVLGSYFLVQEVGWAYLHHWRRGAAGPVTIHDDRSVFMHDGAVKSAGIEAERLADVVETRVLSAWDALGLGGKVAGSVVALSWWMILMTAIFFHTWFEKVSALLLPAASLLQAHSVLVLSADTMCSIVYWSPCCLVWAVRCLLRAPGRARGTSRRWSARNIARGWWERSAHER